MEEQPWIWNEFKLAGAARKFHSILDNGGSDDEDNDNNAVAISDRAAAVSGPSRASIPSAARPSAIFATASNFRDNQQQEEEEEESQQQKQQEQQQQRAGAMTADSPNVLDDYDVYEDRPLMKYALMADGEPAQYYGKLTSNLKRSQQPAPFNPVTGKRRQKQQQQQQRNSMTLSSKSSTGGADAESSVASQQQSSSSSSSSSLAAANIGRDSEPRVLPLLGFHSAVNKINRQKESLLKKILRQAGRFYFLLLFFRFFSFSLLSKKKKHFLFSIQFEFCFFSFFLLCVCVQLDVSQ